MTSDWKLILKVVIGSTLLLFLVIFGLSKMMGTANNLMVDQSVLLDGALLVKENGETKVTVVTFSDMECPACKRSSEMLKGLEEMQGVRYVFRHYPLNIHKNSIMSARAVEAARVMGKGYEMIDLLFAKQEEWTGVSGVQGKLVEYAKELGLDEKAFVDNLTSASTVSVVQKDLVLGDSLRLSGTPTYYVNGEQVSADFVMTRVNDLLKNN